jgi:hypothetical protein
MFIINELRNKNTFELFSVRNGKQSLLRHREFKSSENRWRQEKAAHNVRDNRHTAEVVRVRSMAF